VQIEGLRDEYRRAQHNPGELASFRQLHLNIWAEASGEGPCFVGIDLSSKLDLTAAAAYFPETHSLIVRFWIPSENIEDRKRRDVFDYPRYVREGWIVATDGSVVDQAAIRNQVREWGETYDVQEIGYDPWNASQMAVWLQDEDGFPLTEVRQGFRTLSDPFKALIGLVLDKKLRHGGNPVLAWCAANLKARRDANENWAPVKYSVRKRIDGMVALIMAVLVSSHAEPEKVYAWSVDPEPDDAPEAETA